MYFLYLLEKCRGTAQYVDSRMIPIYKESPTFFSCKVTLFADGLNLVAHTLSRGCINVTGVTEISMIEFWQLVTHIHSPAVTQKRLQM